MNTNYTNAVRMIIKWLTVTITRGLLELDVSTNRTSTIHEFLNINLVGWILKVT
jgi:hypothetical protein